MKKLLTYEKIVEDIKKSFNGLSDMFKQFDTESISFAYAIMDLTFKQVESKNNESTSWIIHNNIRCREIFRASQRVIKCIQQIFQLKSDFDHLLFDLYLSILDSLGQMDEIFGWL
ncbi:MAG: hypothetical protein ACXADY_13915 [Candidatus Hodarchaeales archaeon]|jgi:hypothetical protein